MKGAGPYSVSKKLGCVYLYHRQDDGTQKTIMSVQIPPALGSNTSKTMTWHMTVTWETVVLSTHDHAVMCKPLSYFGEGVYVPVEVKLPPKDAISLKDATGACIIGCILLLFTCGAFFVLRESYIAHQSRHTTRAYPDCMRIGQSFHPGDVFCKGASENHSLDCTAFPHWLVQNQSRFNNLELTLRYDGNLVLYGKEKNTRLLWTADTMGKYCTRVCYEGDDTFKLFCGDENVVISKRKNKNIHLY